MEHNETGYFSSPVPSPYMYAKTFILFTSL